MRTAPVLRGGPLLRASWLVAGLFSFAAGVVCFLDARLGLPPWDVLHQGIAKHTPLSFGAANIAVGVVVLAVAWALGARVGIGTVANAILIGVFISLLTLPDVRAGTLAEQIGLVVAGLALFGIGSAFYIGASLGAGPRDSLMLVGAERSGVRIGAVRATIEAAALLAGFLLGGSIGIGTVAFAALIGPAVEASFWAVSRTRLSS